ncbi:MAG: hypothetical protein AAF629_15630 [Chloroflexota bacterium]
MSETPARQRDEPQSVLSPSLIDRKPLAIVIASAIIILLFFGVIIYLLGLNGATTATIRDIAIILLAAMTVLISFISLVLIVVLVYLILKINDLIQILNDQVRPLFENLNETVGVTKETAQSVQKRVSFVSDEAIKPVVNIVSSAHAVKTIFTTLFKR